MKLLIKMSYKYNKSLFMKYNCVFIRILGSWVTTLCSLVASLQYFGETYRLHLRACGGDMLIINVCTHPDDHIYLISRRQQLKASPLISVH